MLGAIQQLLNRLRKLLGFFKIEVLMQRNLKGIPLTVSVWTLCYYLLYAERIQLKNNNVHPQFTPIFPIGILGKVFDSIVLKSSCKIILVTFNICSYKVLSSKSYDRYLKRSSHNHPKSQVCRLNFIWFFE